MLIHRNFDSLPPIRRPAATIGSYDGVHAGHRAILGRIADIARERGGESVVVTFDPHPRSVVGSAPVMLLNTLPEKLALLAGTGSTMLSSSISRPNSAVSRWRSSWSAIWWGACTSIRCW